MDASTQQGFSRSLALCATVLNGALWMLIAMAVYAAFGSGPSVTMLQVVWLATSVLSGVALFVVSGAQRASFK